MGEVSKRQAYLTRWQALKSERQTWLDHYRELSDQILPRRSRFLTSDRNKINRRNDKIINSTPRRSARILSAGMMAGLTSPARPWFRLTTPDATLLDNGAVRSWLTMVEERLRMIFARSNLYNALHVFFSDLPVFGTATLHVDEDEEDVLRAYVYPVGSYACATSPRQTVDTVFREFSMTVRQLVQSFGREACSARVREAFDRGRYDEWHDVLHIIGPNLEYQEGKIGPTGMPIHSCWLEVAGDDTNGFLRESGYEEMPTLVARWECTGEDVYGTSPGMDALGDCKALQLLERRKAQVVDKIVTPPMIAPASLANRRFSLLPGDVNYVDSISGNARVEPAVVVPPQALPAVNESIARHEERINSIFYADLFLLLAQSNGPQMTAREVAERHEEKLLQLGPVLERLQDELLDPLIDRAFAIALRSGSLPPPPEVLQGENLRVEYISVIAQAQKLLGVTAIDRYAGFVGQIAALRPDALDKANIDQMVNSYADALGVPPDLVIPDEQVAAIRAERAQQAQAQQAMETAAVSAEAAKNLSQATMGRDNALNRLLGAYGAPPTAQGGV